MVATVLISIAVISGGCSEPSQGQIREAPVVGEALVIAEESQADAVWSRIGESFSLTQRLPPRLAIVQGDRAALEAISKAPGVIGVYAADVPDSVLQQLNPSERIFAEAWILRREPKIARPGDGLPWDGDGFQPPDRPTDPTKR
ncbi:MAG: hypothetical protein C5B57_01105 [Blastocatellia bacterium]|nr:MAG: hypothetical protein C5B57_01105 [Blastocatellia bacterium]